MIPGLLKLNDVPVYIFKQTGKQVTLYSVRRWVGVGEIQLVQPQDRDKRFQWTTKQTVDDFIKRHSVEQ